MPRLSRLSKTLIISSALGLTLGACRTDRPVLDQAAAALGLPATIASPYDQYGMLPASHYPPYQGPAPIGRPVSNDDGYAWAERAYAMDQVFYETPPDYGFQYDDMQPYAWGTADDWAMYAEPYQDDTRFYYYEPGEYRPYFIRDDQYGYGYDDDGRLVVLYDQYGQVLPTSYLYEQDDLAGDYYRRGYQLRDVAYRAPRTVITEAVWIVEQPRYVQAQTAWIDAGERQDDWVQYRTRTGQRELRAFQAERQRRDVELTPVSYTREAFSGLRLPFISDREESRERARPARLERERRQVVREVEQAPRREVRQQRVKEERAGRPARAERQQLIRANYTDDQGQARAKAERREKPARTERVRVESQERKQQQNARQVERQAKAVASQRQQEARGRTEAQAKQRQARVEERRQQQAKAPTEARGKAQAEARQQKQRAHAEQRQQQAKAQAEARGKAQAEGRQQKQRADAEQRQQHAKAQAEARGKAQSEARQQKQRAEGEQRQQQAKAQAEARGKAQNEARQARQPEQQAKAETPQDGGAKERGGGNGKGKKG